MLVSGKCRCDSVLTNELKSDGRNEGGLLKSWSWRHRLRWTRKPKSQLCHDQTTTLTQMFNTDH